MKSTSTSLRKTTLALAILAAGTVLVTQASAAGATTQVLKPGQVTNPYSPAYNHAYRHGVMPTRQVQAKMQQWNTAHILTTGPKTLSKAASVAGVGVLKGQSKVYLVFYGTQWGTSSTDANGNLKFTNDTAGAAGAAQQMFKGIGTNNELWSAELTQWCDDAATGATSCAASDTTHIPYQQNIFAGAWYDNSVASPAAATAAQLAAEANKAAAHFGNTTTAANRFTYYVILSPKGTNPDAYQGAYCAWHDYTAGSNGNMAYSNQPYNIDSGAGCGVGFVNSPGTLDGYTMTLGHEWHEMMSDQFPAGGWTNHVSGSANNGQENSDECAWIAAGSTGGAANIAFSTGTFAEQASWSNDTNSCAISHAIVPNGGSGGNVAPTANFSFTTSGLAATFTDSSTDSDGTIASRSWNFGDGGTSTATNPSHTYAAGGTYSVTETVTDNGGLTGSKTSSVAVSGGTGGNVLTNGVAVTGLAATTGNKLNYTMVVPSGATGLSFVQSGGTGDSDMYVKFGAVPTLTTYDCRPYVTGNAETCNIATAQAGTYYVMLNAYSSFTGVSLKGSYSTGGGGCVASGTVMCSGTQVTLPTVATGGVSSTYSIVVPAGKTSLVVNAASGTGDADLYVNFGSAPTTTTYTCRPYTSSSTETCTISAPAAGTYYINVRAYAGFSGETLKTTIN